jgi:hypothetical protein
VAAYQLPSAREEAAAKLIVNHRYVLADMTNQTRVNIHGALRLSQPQLRRVAVGDATYADEALREVVRRLLGRRKGTEQLEVRVDTLTAAQAAVWAQAVKFLESRVQDRPEQVPGRAPDMSIAAAAAMKAVLVELSISLEKHAGIRADTSLIPLAFAFELTALVVFLVSVAVLIVLYITVEGGRPHYVLTLMVNLVAALCYLAKVTGMDTLTLLSWGSALRVPTVRYLDWLVTTPLIMYELCSRAHPAVRPSSYASPYTPHACFMLP